MQDDGDEAGPPRRSYHVGNVRSKLLEEARAMLESGGLAQLNLRTLATRAGIAPGSVYHHFDSKTALLGQLACEGFRDLKQALSASAAASPGGVAVRGCASAYFAFARRQPAIYALMFDPELLALPEVSRQRDEAFGALEEAIGRAPSQQGRTPEILHKVSVAVWTCTHGAASMAAARAGGPELLEEVIQGLEALFGRR